MENYLLKRCSDIQGFRAGDATLIKELIHPKNDKLQLPYSLAWGNLEKGASSLPHILQNEELYYILDGQAFIYIENQKIEVKKGDSLLVLKGKKQYVTNTGDNDLKFLCIVSPAWEAGKEEILRKI